MVRLAHQELVSSLRGGQVMSVFKEKYKLQSDGSLFTTIRLQKNPIAVFDRKLTEKVHRRICEF